MEASFTDDGNTTTHLSEYELERNNRKKDLHDALQEAFRAAGFSDAAALRALFSGEATTTVGNSEQRAKKPARRKKKSSVSGLVLRRTSRRKKAEQQQRDATAAQSPPCNKKEFKL